MNKISQFIFWLCICAAPVVHSDNSSVPANTRTSELFPIKQRFIEWMLDDQKFVDKAVEAGRAEVELSQLALQKSTNTKVRGFSQKMIEEHNKASLELKEIAQARSLKVPLEMDLEHAKALKKLESLEGANFDAYYIDLMVEDHEKNVSLFVAATADKTLDPKIQAFAQKTLPILRAHLGHAKSLGTAEISSPQ